jgi:hypothetical protein
LRSAIYAALSESRAIQPVSYKYNSTALPASTDAREFHAVRSKDRCSLLSTKTSGNFVLDLLSGAILRFST